MLTHRRSIDRFRSTSSALLTALLLAAFIPGTAHAQRVVLAARTFGSTIPGTDAVDIGPVPASQALQLTLRLTPTPDRIAALDQLLSDQVTPSSPAFHQWLTPQQFAATYGATDDQLATVNSWLQAQGLTVVAISAAKTRLTVTGSAAQVQSALSVTLHRYQISGATHFANVTQPSLPQDIASLIAGVSGLDDIPAASTTTLATIATTGKTTTLPGTGPLAAAAAAIDANADPILTLTTNACSSDLAPSDYAAYRDLFRQANAQGITVLATSACGTRGTGSFPASLAEVAAITTAPVTAPFVPIEQRPDWQRAPGLPADIYRHEPDLTTSSITDFAQALTTILQESASRQGNINATLYEIASTPNLYTQPDAATGTWEPATGLGVIDLATLVKVFPHGTGTTSTTTTLLPSSTIASYGAPVTLTATVQPSTTGNASPTGTVVFSAGAQGVIGTASVVNGTATITISTFGVGSYTLTASYLGDSSYAASTSSMIPFSTVKGSTTTTVATLRPDVHAGEPISLIASIANAGYGTDASGFTGVVTFSDHGKIIATTSVVANQGTVSAVLPSIPLHSITATYTGDANWNTSVSTPKAVSSSLLPASINLTSNVSSLSSTLAGVNIILTATVFPTTANSVSPTGTVTFFDTYNGKVVQIGSTTNLIPNGSSQAVAVFSSTALPAGSHSVYAVYNGDATYASTTSFPMAFSLADYSLTMVPQTLTINRGKSAKVVMVLGNIGGFSGTVTFGCTPPSNAEATCSFSPLTLNGGGSTTMTITTTAPTAAQDKPTTQARLARRWSFATGSALATLLCFLVPRRRRLLPTLLLLLIACSLTANLGCSVALPSNVTQDPTPTTPADPGTPLGTQTFSITTAGSDGVNTVRHNYQYQVTIQ
jgi:hypothetical protein